MATIIELGQKVKAKYPEYQDMDDAEVGRRVKAKYPTEYADFTDVEPTKPKKTFAEKAGNVLDVLFGGGKVGEALGTSAAKAKIQTGEGVVMPEYEKLSEEAKQRLQAKGVPTTREQQLEEVASQIKGPTGTQILGDVGRMALTFAPVGTAAKGLATGLSPLGRLAKPTANILTGGGLGYAADVTTKIAEGVEKPFQPGGGTALGAGLASVPYVGKALTRGAAELLGGSTGVGAGAIKQFTKAIVKGGEEAKAARGALRGDVAPTEVVDEAKTALGTIIKNRTDDYSNQLSQLKTKTNFIDHKPVIDSFNKQLQDFGVFFNADGTPNFSRSPGLGRYEKDLKQLSQTLSDWGSQPGDNTIAGIDKLKQVIDDFRIGSQDSKKFDVFVSTLRTEAKNSIKKSLTASKDLKTLNQYEKMLKDYELSTKDIREIQKSLSLGDRASVDTAFRKLSSVLRTNNEIRKLAVDQLNELTGGTLIPKIAGQQLSELAPRGLVRPLGIVGAGYGALTGASIISMLRLALFASPRIVGELLNILGIVGNKAKIVKDALLKTGLKTPGDYIIEQSKITPNKQGGFVRLKGKGEIPKTKTINTTKKASDFLDAWTGTNAPKGSDVLLKKMNNKEVEELSKFFNENFPPITNKNGTLTLYRGIEEGQKGGLINRPTSWTRRKDVAEMHTYGEGKVEKIVVKPDQVLLDTTSMPRGLAQGHGFVLDEEEVILKPSKTALLDKIKNIPNKQGGMIQAYKGEKDLTTKILKDLEGKTTVSKQYILDATNRPELKQVERDLIRQILEDTNIKTKTKKINKYLEVEELPNGDVVMYHGTPSLKEVQKSGYVDPLFSKNKSGNSFVTPDKIYAQNYAQGKNSGVVKVVIPKKEFEKMLSEVKKEAKIDLENYKALGEDREVVEQYIIDKFNEYQLNKPTKILSSDTINVSDFAKKVKAELLPLKVKDTSKMPKQGFLYENISLPDELRGSVKNYDERIYESPIKTSAGDIHFSREGVPNYFGHTRIEDMADNKTRRVIEVQSDLYQKGALEREFATGAKVDKEWEKELREIGLKGKELEEALKGTKKYDPIRKKSLKKLQQYNDPTAHFRMIREEIKKASQDGKTKLQFPTGETAMKIEGLANTENPWAFTRVQGNLWHAPRADFAQMKAGKEIIDSRTGQDWIITDVLGDGKFKATPKHEYTIFKEGNDYLIEDSRGVIQEAGLGKRFKTKQDAINEIEKIKQSRAETFDISGKVDTNNPIYKFYEKDVQRYLNKFGGKRIIDDKGVSWIEVPIKKEWAKMPVEAFGKVALSPLGVMAGLSAGAVGANKLLSKKLPNKPEKLTKKEKEEQTNYKNEKKK